MSTKLKVGIAVGVVAAAIPVASVLGSGESNSPGPGQPSSKAASAGVETAAVHQVLGPGTPASGTAAKAKTQPLKLAYFQTKKLDVKKGRSGLVVGPVPKHCNVLNGYYFHKGNLNSTAVLSMGDSPSGFRKWAFYRFNNTGKTVKDLTYGVICAKPTQIIGQ
jgi:hypothetical protein